MSRCSGEAVAAYDRANRRDVALTPFPDYSPDGSRVAFTMAIPTAAQPDIDLIDRDGTALVQLTNDPSFDGYPVWSPDRWSIAFVSDRTSVAQVWLMNADGSNPIQLTFDPFPKGQLPDWSPDGEDRV
jgi:Tol biopolymer transport system component